MAIKLRWWRRSVARLWINFDVDGQGGMFGVKIRWRRGLELARNTKQRHQRRGGRRAPIRSTTREGVRLLAHQAGDPEGRDYW